ncbi:MAG: apolipoprotein N-acyltransferase [Methylococcales bacterium]|nr:apolipoprotein N-acyltransferase [Methylococcales bacterium]
MRLSSTHYWDLLATLAGVLFTLAFAPFDYAYLAIVALALLFASWQSCTAKRALWRGYLFGLGSFGLGVSWVFVSIHHFGKAGLLNSSLMTGFFFGFWALFPALAGYLAVQVRQLCLGRGAILSTPVVWLLVEYLRGYWVLNGFPWLQCAYSQLATPLAGYIPIVGVYGTGFFVALSAAIIVYLCQPNHKRLAWGVGLLLVWVLGGILQTVSWTYAIGAPFRVSLIQGNVAQDKKWLPEFKENTLQFYKTMTEAHWDSAVIVWPETSIPAYYSTVYDWFLMPLNQAAQQHNTDLIVSLPAHGDSEDIRYNAVMTLGKASTLYKKKHLLPFGEFLPWQPLSGFVLESLGIKLGDFTPGDIHQALLKAGGYPLISSICYEDAFGEAGLIGLPEAAYLVNVTNDGWFGDSIEPHQHMQIARLRALETGRYLLRSANTGITAIVAPDGKITSQLPLFTATVLTDSITPMGGMTPYARLGDRPVLIALMLSLVACCLLTRNRRGWSFPTVPKDARAPP